jgi:hypothetical protein
MAKLVAALVAVMALASTTHDACAEPPGAVGLYRLDTDKKLEIYGQPITNVLARVLTAAGIEVVVVGADEKTPKQVKLVVNGKIESKGAEVVLTVTMHALKNGEPYPPLSKTAPAITKLDKAAAELSAELLAKVQKILPTLPDDDSKQPPVEIKPAVVAPKAKLALFAVVASGAPADEPIRQALGDALAPWTEHHGREVRLVDPKSLSAELAAKTIAATNTDLGVLFEVVDFVVEAGEVPMARARVHVRIADGNKLLLDRVVVTDTVVGDKNMPLPALAARTARAVLSIVTPFIHRKVSGWRGGD